MGTSLVPPSAGPRYRSATILLVLVGASIAIALVVGAVLARRGPEYPEGSPEAAAQGYLQAIFDDDEPAARNYLAAELIDDCGPIGLDYPFRAADSVRFVDVATRDGHADIELEFGYSSDYEPFAFPIDEPRRSPRPAQLQLEQRNEVWVIVAATWIPEVCRER